MQVLTEHSFILVSHIMNDGYGFMKSEYRMHYTNMPGRTCRQAVHTCQQFSFVHTVTIFAHLVEIDIEIFVPGFYIARCNCIHQRLLNLQKLPAFSRMRSLRNCSADEQQK